jgi:uncharacterized tellurite resistance protein B-like protein
MKPLLRRLLASRHSEAPARLSPALAVAQLLLEIARADEMVQGAELAVVRQHLTQAYGLSAAQLDALLIEAKDNVEQATTLYDTVQQVNAHMSPDDKAQLMQALWQVAYADGRIDPFEEALLRRLADLIYVPHSVFIRSKLTVMDGET